MSAEVHSDSRRPVPAKANPLLSTRLGVPLYVPILTAVVVLSVLFAVGLREQLALQSERVTLALAGIEQREHQTAAHISGTLKEAETSVLRAVKRLQTDLDQAEPTGATKIWSRVMQPNADGSWRPRPETFDASRDAAVLVPTFNPLDDRQKYLFTVIRQSLSGFGQGALGHAFVDTWWLSKDGGFVIFWPDEPKYVLTADQNFEWRETDWFLLSSKQRNPDQKPLWTPLVFDPVAKQWQLSVVAPLSWQGQWLGAVGHDLPLSSLLAANNMEQNITGARYVLSTDEGLVIASDQYGDNIVAASGQLNITKIHDENLQQAWQQSRKRVALGEPHVRINMPDEVALISRINGPNWWLLQIVPLAPVEQPIASSFERLRNLALSTLACEMLFTFALLWWTHRRNHLAMADISATRQELQDSKDRLNEVIEHASDAIFMLQVGDDGELYYDLWNPRAEEVIGMTAEQIIGHTAAQLWPPDIAREVDENYRRCLHSGVVQRYEEHFGNDKIRWQTTLVPVRNDSGVIYRIAGFAHDISHEFESRKQAQQRQQELEERVQQRTHELQQTSRELEAISYAVSHDLRAPLRHLDGFINILRESMEVRLSKDESRLINRMDSAFTRMTRLVEGLLAFLRASRREMKEQPVALQVMVHDIANYLQEGSTGPDVKWQIGKLPVLRADQELMREMFVQLLSNALYFSREREQPTISVQSEVDQDWLVLSVTDNGCGFDSAHAEMLFEVYQRLHMPENTRGPGVGLAIVRRIVERHGGQVSARGEKGSGATIVVRFPRSRLLGSEQSS